MKRLFPLLALGLTLASCGKQETGRPQAQAEPAPAAPSSPAAPVVVEAPKIEAPKVVTEAPAPADKPSPYAVTDPNQGLGDFGSLEPIERPDMPQRGVITYNVGDHKECFAPMEHWEQYNIPFKSRRWGGYNVRISYTLKSSALGVQFKMGEERFKKQLTAGVKKYAYLGEVYVPNGGDQFMAFYTPNGVGWGTFLLHDISLVPTSEGEEVKVADDGSLHLLAKDATTWSQNMRFEPKEEKNCLGFWTDLEDFAEWEFKVEKPGKYKVTVHQGCGAGGGSEVAVLLGDQQLKFTVQDTGGFQKWAPVNVGEVEIKEGGTYRLAVKPQSKNGSAIMDVQKIVLVPVS